MITNKAQLDEFFATHSEEIARELMQKSQTWYEKIEDFAGQEFSVPATEKQLNDAIQKFVVEKVKAILSMHRRFMKDGFDCMQRLTIVAFTLTLLSI